MPTLLIFMMHTAEKLAREGLRTRDAHLLEALDADPRVSKILVVDRPVTPGERVSRRESPSTRAAIPAQIGLTKTQLLPTTSRAVVRPILMRSRWWGQAYDTSHLTAGTSRMIAEALGTADAAISFVPTAHHLWAGGIPTVFDLLDNWLIHPQLGGADVKPFELHYRRSFDSAAWVTANSEGTAELAARFGRTALVLPNGVDREAFQLRARATAGRWREQLGSLPRPWFVYAGKMQERVDVQLLVELRRRMTGSLILAGPVLNKRWVRPIAEMDGVTWLNDVPYPDLPGLLAVADVALIPHRVGDGELGGDPLKAHEYAAVGARFVSTAITGADRIRKRGVVVDSPGEFVDAVIRLGCDDRPFEDRLIESIDSRADSWTAKADAILRLIESNERVAVSV